MVVQRVIFACAVLLGVAACTAPVVDEDAKALDQTPLLTGQGILLGSTPIPFGTPAAAAEETLRRLWGDPDGVLAEATTAVPWGYCGGTSVRVLTWGDVHVLFTDVVGPPALTGWRWDGSQGPQGIGVSRDLSGQAPVVRHGQSVAELEQSYPYFYAVPVRVGGEFGFAIPHERMVRDTPLLESGITGTVTSPEGDGAVTTLEAGSLCGY